MKEYKVGEEFDIEGVEYVCVEDAENSPCIGCRLSNFCKDFNCCMGDRKDGLDIHFEKVTP